MAPTNGSAAAHIAKEASRVCSSISLPGDAKVDLSTLLTAALEDASLVDEKAGVVPSLIAACRKAIEAAPQAGVERDRKLDYAAAEVLSVLWADPGYCEAWAACGHGEELKTRCPLSEILGGARFALGYGDDKAQRMYFSNFSRLATHASMMADETRTHAYYRAMMHNKADFEGKVVMDVGSGSGILAFFAVKAGAAKVYCIEASPMEKVIRTLADANGFGEKIVVVNKVLQEIREGEIPEKVDCIVSETLGNCLFAERGIETVIIARERFLKPEGKLFPCKATLAVAPFSDEARFKGRNAEALYFWTQKDYYGIDMSVMKDAARDEIFRRPLGENFHPDQLKADAILQEYDFRTLRSENLVSFNIDLKFTAKETCVLHGLATWFEAHFEGSSCSVILSTSPWDTLTHWWQTRLMLLEPLAVNNGQEITGNVDFVATEANTYDVKLVMEANGCRLENAGMSLLDLDTGHRSVSHKEQAVSETNMLRVPDYNTTRPTPTGAKEIVSDPLRPLKIEVAQVEARVASRVYRENPDRPFGSQIKVNEQLFMLVDEAELCAQLTQPKAALQMVGNLGDTMIMTPQDHLYKFLIQYSTTKTGVQTSLWMEKNLCQQHMKAALTTASSNGAAARDVNQVAAMTSEELFFHYDRLRQGIL